MSKITGMDDHFKLVIFHPGHSVIVLTIKRLMGIQLERDAMCLTPRQHHVNIMFLVLMVAQMFFYGGLSVRICSFMAHSIWDPRGRIDYLARLFEKNHKIVS